MEIRYSEHARGCKGCEHSKRTFEGKQVHDWKKAYGKWPITIPRSFIAETANESCALCASHAQEVSSSPITGDQIDWIREIPAPQNRTHNTQLINNARHKNHEVVYTHENLYPRKF